MSPFKILVFLVTVAVGLLLIPVGMVVGLLSFRYDVRRYVRGVGLSLSQLLNTTSARLLTALCTGPGGMCFGNPDITTSAVLGWNYVHGTLLPVGEFLIWWLDILESEHCVKAYRAQWIR